jgi:hypothetical protein
MPPYSVSSKYSLLIKLKIKIFMLHEFLCIR